LATPWWYDDVGGRLSRRLAVFVFDTTVKHIDTQISTKICSNELVAVMLRCIRSYHSCRREVGDRALRDAFPGVLLSIDEVKMERSPLAAFVTEGDDVYTVMSGDGEEMPLVELQEAFEDHVGRNKQLRGEKWTDHRHVLDTMEGISVKKVHACKKCNKRSSLSGCGKHYDINRRAKREFVIGMRLAQR
jgi:hypothetical protein